jgi:hypothetical protein
MVLHSNRRWLCLLTALVFAISSMAHAYAMTDAAMKMPSGAMESSAPDHGMDCGGGPDKATCMAICAMAVAILSAPVAISFVAAMQDIEAAPELPPPGASLSPEPHPPKH